ncbi:MAG TPA: glycoside hydrolase family 15 protein [Kofleriaceae bacterium]|nr:glycoside hydrolase family 15 protein [Kofleriaceae bacterium]
MIPALVVIGAVARPAHAVDPVASFRYLVTGNGFGFQVYDQSANAIKQYLERPYRYLRANPSNPDGEGIVRRNLAFDTYFGVKAGSTAQWLGSVTPTSVEYENQTNIIHTASTVGAVTADSYLVAPFGYEGNALVMLLKVTNTSGGAVPVTAFAIHNFKLGSASNPDVPDANGEAINWNGTVATETGPGGGAMVYAPIGGADVSSCDPNTYTTVQGGGTLTLTASCSGTDQKNAEQKNLGSLAPGASAWWGVAVLFDSGGDTAGTATKWATFLNGRAADKLHDDLLAEWDAYRTAPPAGLTDTETKVWRQAETVLRMGQILEPYQDSPRQKNHGMILASLPPGGWHTGWVRDGTYATTAFARTGHADRAKDSLNFFLDADAGRYGSYLNNVPYRISTVRYYGDGQEEADYSGSTTRNIEIDGWGLFLWSARQYVDASNDAGWLAETTKQGDTVYDAIKNGVAEPLAANMETSGITIADASIWEVHWGNRQHFMYTTAATARGFCDMATLARRAGRMDDVTRYRDLATKTANALAGAYVDSNNVLAGSLEKLQSGTNYHDGSTIEAVTFGVLAPDNATATATLDGLSHLVTPAGGYKRLEGSQDTYDINEWILIDLRASDAFRRAGQTAKADSLLAWVSSQASVNYNLLPELYNTVSSGGAIGSYAGSIPMVGYGAGAYMLTLLDRAGAYEHSDCGEYDAGDYPDAGTGGGLGGGSDSGNARTGVACACQGGPGSAGNAVMFAIAGVLVMRRRRRAV